jgi:hypothetical protein
MEIRQDDIDTQTVLSSRRKSRPEEEVASQVLLIAHLRALTRSFNASKRAS